MAHDLTFLLESSVVQRGTNNQWNFLQGDPQRIWNYSQFLRNYPSIQSITILSMTVEDAICGSRAERRGLQPEDYLLLRHPFGFRHAKKCSNISSFHYQLYHLKGVRSTSHVWAMIQDGWMLNNHKKLVRRFPRDETSSDEN